MASKTATKKKASGKVNLEPLGDNVIIERVEAETTTKGGILLPDSAKEKPQQGVVISVGAGRLNDDGKRTPVAVKVKDRVIFSSYAGTEIKVGGDTYLLVREDEIRAVVS